MDESAEGATIQRRHDRGRAAFVSPGTPQRELIAEHLLSAAFPPRGNKPFRKGNLGVTLLCSPQTAFPIIRSSLRLPLPFTYYASSIFPSSRIIFPLPSFLSNPCFSSTQSHRFCLFCNVLFPPSFLLPTFLTSLLQLSSGQSFGFQFEPCDNQPR